MNRVWDAIVVGGGPGGLSAAFWLARYRRRTLVLDDARPRNEDAWAVHGFPGIEDLQPVELRRRLRHQAMAAGALIERRRVLRVTGEKDAFQVEDDQGGTATARRVVLAYGRTDRIPDLPGLRDLYGTSVFHCPDCDGPSVADCDVGVLGHDTDAAALALYLLTWASRTVLLTNGLAPDLQDSAMSTLEQHRVDIETAAVERVVGSNGSLHEVRLAGGRTLPLGALFFHWGSEPASDLARVTGCDIGSQGHVRVDRSCMETSVPGLYAAGDIVGRPHLAISAAAEGVRAALSIHRSLLPDEFRL
jgi:thioredoxin reductase